MVCEREIIYKLLILICHRSEKKTKSESYYFHIINYVNGVNIDHALSRI